MFIAALLTIAKTWKQIKCLLTEEWIKKMWYMCTVELLDHMVAPFLVLKGTSMLFSILCAQLRLT